MKYPRVTRRPWTIAAAAAVLLAAGLTPLPAQPLFTDATAEAGLGYLQHHAAEPPDCLLGETGGYCMPERMSGGAAAGDADGDGWVDLYVTRLDGADLLFINQRDGTFRDTSVESGLASFELQSNGAVFVDIDNDGDLDLFVTTIGRRGDPVNGRYYLFVNDGAGHFTRGGACPSPGVRRTRRVHDLLDFGFVYLETRWGMSAPRFCKRLKALVRGAEFSGFDFEGGPGDFGELLFDFVE